MSLDVEFLQILRCPVTQCALRRVEPAELTQLNESIAAGEVRTEGGAPATSPLEDALVTTAGNRYYRVEDGIPVLLREEAVVVSMKEKAR